MGDPKRVKMERRCVGGSDRPREPRGVAAFLRTPALRPRRGFLAHCADPMYLWDVYPVTRRIGERAPRWRKFTRRVSVDWCRGMKGIEWLCTVLITLALPNRAPAVEPRLWVQYSTTFFQHSHSLCIAILTLLASLAALCPVRYGYMSAQKFINFARHGEDLSNYGHRSFVEEWLTQQLLDGHPLERITTGLGNSNGVIPLRHRERPVRTKSHQNESIFRSNATKNFVVKGFRSGGIFCS